MNIIDQITNEAREIYAANGGCHDWDHVIRVSALCAYLGKKEKANPEILELAAILHDIGRSEEDSSQGRSCHEEIGAEKARGLLTKYKINKEIIDNVIHCIESHRYRGQKRPITKEARILFDADKLDSIGAVGIGRAFLFAGQVGAKLHNSKNTNIEDTMPYTKEDTAYREFVVKLSKIKDVMLTDEGKRLAGERHEFMVQFFERLKREIDGDY